MIKVRPFAVSCVIAAAALLCAGSAHAKPRRGAARAAVPVRAPVKTGTTPATEEVPPVRTASGAATLPASAGTSGGRATVQRESHIEFDERLVQGQTAAGAIYLFQRGESEFHSMIDLPASFRDRTVRQLLVPSEKR